MPPQTLAAVATLLSFAPHGNRIELRLDRGAAEMVWVSPSTFRFRRTLDGPLPDLKIENRAPIAVDIDEEPGLLRARSKFLEVSIQKRGLLVRVRRFDGTPLMTDLTEPASSDGAIAWERESPAGARFYGLGPRADPGFDLLGKTAAAPSPLLLSTSGYGEYHPANGSHRFDFTGTGRYRIEAPAIDYFFYYGPTLKQIFEEHKDVRTAAEPPPLNVEGVPSWTSLHETLLRLVNGAMSALPSPSLALRPWASAAPDLRQRAQQLGSLVEDVSPGPLGLSHFRRQLETFFATYATETQMKGFPIWHPLPFQFPEDPECARHADEFMLGDEMLIAPVYEPGNRRSVYLPQGVWTNMETNEPLRGRRTITVDSATLPAFARNGSIVPLDTDWGIELHYFPTLAAEFFLLETDPDDWTQVHAAPAAEIMRLEIEAKKAREYEWVIHHIDRPSEVSFGERKYREVASGTTLADGAWHYDAERRNLAVRVRVRAGEDSIVNLSF